MKAPTYNMREGSLVHTWQHAQVWADLAHHTNPPVYVHITHARAHTHTYTHMHVHAHAHVRVHSALPTQALCAVPVELLVMADVLQRELQSLRGIRLSERQSLQLRMLLWLPAAALSLGSFETVHHVIIFTGCVALLTSGLLPAALHLRLLWQQLSGLRRTLIVFEGAAALGLAVLIVVCLPAVGILPSLDTVGMPHRTAVVRADASLSSTTMLSNIVSSEVGQRVLGPT